MVLVFDAQCLMCEGWVRFLLKHDRWQRLRFASIQTDAGRHLLARAGLEVEHLQTLLLVDGPRSWQHRAAILRVLHTLGGAWRLAWLGWPGSGTAARRGLSRDRTPPLPPVRPQRGLPAAGRRAPASLSGMKNRPAGLFHRPGPSGPRQNSVKLSQ